MELLLLVRVGLLGLIQAPGRTKREQSRLRYWSKHDG